ncbi:MAG: undecaprenyl-diphosphate phosphatase [Lachnospiraceae bacterium]|nr:undecaprenyl-diphosphate phosphatase [Lachnospiraceae bacterium]
MLEFLKVILIGIVEGITEWLPISSTGHMILVDEFIKLNVSQEFWNMFKYVIQLGAIMAVVVLYWNKIWPFKNDKNQTGIVARYVKMDKITLWLKIAVSCLPAIIIGLPLDDIIEEKLSNYVVVALMLILYGVLFIVIENYNKRRKPKVSRLEDITWSMAAGIGIFQLLAMIPGTSRSGATIIGGILIGLSRKIAAEYTFFLAIPVMFGVSFIKILKFGLNFTAYEAAILIVGMVVAFVVSILAIKFLMGYIKKHDFKVFGWYRIVLGIIVLIYFACKSIFFA